LGANDRAWNVRRNVVRVQQQQQLQSCNAEMRMRQVTIVSMAVVWSTLGSTVATHHLSAMDI